MHQHDGLRSVVHRVALGDETAMAELYDATAPRLYGLALRLLQDPAPAEAVTRATYNEVWTTAADLDATGGSDALVRMLVIVQRRAKSRRCRSTSVGMGPLRRGTDGSSPGPRLSVHARRHPGGPT